MFNPFRMIRKKHLHAITRHFWGAVFTFIIALAIIVQLGRQAFPLINDYRDVIAQNLGDSLGVVISVKSIDATWSGLKPKITLNDVAVNSAQGEEIFTVVTATAELSLIDTFMQRGLSWRRIIFNDFDTRFVQTENNRWHINGYDGGTANDEKSKAFTIDDPFDIFVFGRRVEINAANIALQFNSGLESVITIPKINLENDRYFHRMTANVKLDENEQAFTLVLEGYGDPRSQKEFSARGYLHLKNFSTERVVAAVAGEIWEGKNDARWRDEQRLDLKLWFQGSSLTGVTFTGNVFSNGLPIKLPKDFTIPSALTSNISGYVHPQKGWNVDFSNVNLTWLERSAPISTLSISGQKKQVTFTTPSVDIGAWRALFVDAGLDKFPKVNEAITALSPQGVLDNVSVQLKSKEDGYFFAQAYLKEGSVGAYLGSPEIYNVNGQVEASLWHGAIDLKTIDGLSLFLPKIYEKPLTFAEAEGIVDWRLDLEKHHAYINSSLLRVKNEDELAHGYLNLDLPFSKEWGEPWMTLMIGVDKSKAIYHKKYIPSIVESGLRHWLNSAIKSGDVVDGQFVYSGSLDVKASHSPTILVQGSFVDAAVKFDAGWPKVTHANGYFGVENTHFSGKVFTADFHRAQITDADIVLEHSNNQGPLAIRVTAHAETRAEHVKDLLYSSPIKKTLPAAIDSWVLKGDATADVDIQVPLSMSADGSLDVSYDFDVELKSVDIDMVNLNLPVKKVSGKLNYSSRQLLTAKKLKSELWGESLVTSISSDHFDQRKDRFMHVDVVGNISSRQLEIWTKRPELHFLDGKFKLKTQTIVPLTSVANHPLRLNFSSNLVGTDIHLPAPFGKNSKQAVKLTGSAVMVGESATYHVELEDILDLVAIAEEGHKAAVSVRFPDPKLAPSGDNQDLVSRQKNSTLSHELKPGLVSMIGHLPSADFKQWQTLIAQYVAYQEEFEKKQQERKTTLSNEVQNKQKSNEPDASSANVDEESEPYALVVDAEVDVLHVGDFDIPALHLLARNDNNSWLFDIQSPIAAGRITLGNDNSVPRVDLDYLKINSEPNENKIRPKVNVNDGLASVNDDVLVSTELVSSSVIDSEAENTSKTDPDNLNESAQSEEVISEDALSKDKESDVSVLSGIALTDIPELVVSVADTEITNVKYGHWKFILNPSENIIRVKHIVGSIHGLQVGLESDPANLTWSRVDGADTTTFHGKLFTKDISEVLDGFGQEKILTSTSGLFDADISWAGAPDEFRLPSLEGNVRFRLEQGSFIKGAEVGENPLLRLIALFNFDTMARRLKLDFSDLAAKGYAYDSVEGNLLFDRGMLLLKEPVVLESSSSKMQLAGTIDLINEQIDSEVVATLPVAGNLAVAAAFVAGFPAAVGVYVVGKLFKDQVDKASSINYSITGSWSDPKIKINRIFDDSAAKEKGKKVKKAEEITEVGVEIDGTDVETSNDESSNKTLPSTKDLKNESRIEP